MVMVGLVLLIIVLYGLAAIVGIAFKINAPTIFLLSAASLLLIVTLAIEVATMRSIRKLRQVSLTWRYCL